MTSSETSSDEAMISCTFPQSVLQQMRPGEGEVQGSSAVTENPANSLRSMVVGFASGHSEDDYDDRSRQTEESQAEEAPPQGARGPSAFGGGRKRKATSEVLLVESFQEIEVHYTFRLKFLLCVCCWIASKTGRPVTIKWDNCQCSFQGSCVCSS